MAVTAASAFKKGTATLLEPVGEPGEAREATSVTLPEGLAAVGAQRRQGEADNPFHSDSTIGRGGALELLVDQAKIGQAFALSGTCPLCQAESPAGAQRVVRW